MAKTKKKNKNYQFNLEDQYRQLRANIEFSQIDSDLKVLNITSTQPDEGKSSVAKELAKIYAAKYQKVLLIDCDLHKRTLHKMLNVSNAQGLTNLLTHYDTSVIINSYEEIQTIDLPDGNKLDFLSAGTKIPNPTEAINSKRYAHLIEEARKQYNIVIIDCPPIMATSDAIPISNLADGTLFVYSAKETNKYEARDATQILRRNGANLIGVIMTKVPSYQTRHYYYDYSEKS